MKRVIPILAALLLMLSCAAASAEDSFPAIPGYTVFPSWVEDGSFVVMIPREWDELDVSGAYGVPLDMVMQDEAHMAMIAELSAEDQLMITVDLQHPLNGFLQEGRSVTRGKSTEGSRILEEFSIAGLPAVRVEMVGQGFEMVWVSDGFDLWFIMYPTDPADEAYTAQISQIVESFTVVYPSSIPDAAASDFEYTVGENGVTITAWKGEQAYVRVPAEIEGKPVTAVGGSAFYEAGIREITFPDSVTELGSYVFSGCNELMTVRLPANLKTLPEGAFESCFSLSQVDLNEGLERIGKFAFWADNCLWYLVLPDSLEEIEEPNFIAMADLGWFTVSENSKGFMTAEDETVLLTKDGKRLIRCTWCYEGESYTVPEGVEKIDQNAFYGAEVTEVILPESLRSIGSLAFAMTDIREITIPAGVTEIGTSSGYQDEAGNPVSGSTGIFSYKNVIIHGWPGSVAESYCAQHGYTFVPVETAEEAAGEPLTEETETAQ